MLICASVWVKGHHGERMTVEWVTRLHRAMRRNIRNHTYHVCLTDRPDELPPWIEGVDIGEWWAQYRDRTDGLYNPLGGWWAKVKLFDPKVWSRFRGGYGAHQILYLDLDCLVTGDLGPLLAMPGYFRTLQDTAENRAPKPGVFRSINTSVMSWTSQAFGEMYERFGIHTIKQCRSDQDYIGLFLEIDDALLTMPQRYTERLSACIERGGPLDTTRVILCIKPKNDVAAREHEWVRTLWEG